MPAIFFGSPEAKEIAISYVPAGRSLKRYAPWMSVESAICREMAGPASCTRAPGTGPSWSMTFPTMEPTPISVSDVAPPSAEEAPARESATSVTPAANARIPHARTFNIQPGLGLPSASTYGQAGTLGEIPLSVLDIGPKPHEFCGRIA